MAAKKTAAKSKAAGKGSKPAAKSMRSLAPKETGSVKGGTVAKKGNFYNHDQSLGW
ncbi:MAG: hypothetical protein ABI765_17475 [Gemmatimonadota bacterium]